MLSDSTTTRNQKNRRATELRAIGFLLPEWFIEGANASDLKRFLGQAYAARERYDEELRRQGTTQQDIHLKNHFSPRGDPITACPDKICQLATKRINAAKGASSNRRSVRPLAVAKYRELSDDEEALENNTWD